MPVWGRILVQLPSWPDAGDLNRWRRDILDAFDPDDFVPDGPLQQVSPEDWDLVPCNDGSGWLELGLWLNYYFEGYERGDPARFVEYAEWLENHLPGSRIYYGHDNSAELIEPFDRTQRTALLEYYERVGHQPYEDIRQARVDFAKKEAVSRRAVKNPAFVPVSPRAVKSPAFVPGAANTTLDPYESFQVIASLDSSSTTSETLQAEKSNPVRMDRNQPQTVGSISSSSSSTSES